MKDARRARLGALAGVAALALTLGAAAKLKLARREARAAALAQSVFAAEADLRDAVAAPAMPATVGLAGRPVPTSWFKTPAQRRVDIDTALLSSRRRRALARRVAVQ